MSDKQEILKQLPKIDVLLADEKIARFAGRLGRRDVAEICRAEVERAKAETLASHRPPQGDRIVEAILAACRRQQSKMLGRVINGTGVLLHTNLGRAPLGPQLFDEMRRLLSGYCNVEIDVLERRRSVRAPGVVNLLRQACDAEDAVVVNNNAAALFLILSTFAAGRQVLVSRGELVQIGGGFRIPSILESAGATLKEVGTTNITTVADYREGLSDETAMVLKVHKANFRMTGFVESPDLRQLRQAALGDTLLVSDLGSGNLIHRVDGLQVTEPTPGSMLKAGADLVCFSCDKMLGGVQGGVIAGRADLIARVKKHPVMRVVRPGKMTYAALQVILQHHLAGNHKGVFLYELASKSQGEIANRVERFLKEHRLGKPCFEPVACESTFGGGSTPGLQIPSQGLAVRGNRSPDEIADLFQQTDPPVIGTVKEYRFVIDFRTVPEPDEDDLAVACKSVEKAIR